MLETIHPEIVSDRFNNGGLNPSQPSRLGRFLSSWSQTRYRIGEVDISSAVDGTPLLFPALTWWRGVDVHATAIPLDMPAPGLAVVLTPHELSRSWSGVVEGFASGGRLAGGSLAQAPPPIATLQDSTRGSGFVSGPIASRVRLGLGAEWADATIDVKSAQPRRQHLTTVVSQALVSPSANVELRAFVIAQRASGDPATHMQASLENKHQDAVQWSVHAGHTYGERDAGLSAKPRTTADRLVDGPIPALIAGRGRSERQWSVGGRVLPRLRPKQHALLIAGELSRAQVREPPMPAASVTETLDGQPARIWTYSPTERASRRHALSGFAFLRDRILLSDQLQLDAAVRLEYVTGRADGGAIGIAWTTVSPAVQMRWQLRPDRELWFVIGARRVPHRLMLETLTVGDPASPAADVYRWEPSSADQGPLIARVGPGIRADVNFSGIDPHLRRPLTDELLIGLDSRPRQSLRVTVSGVARRQSHTVQLTNIGVALDSYRAFAISDANVDLVKPDDDQQLTVYDHSPDSFGKDQYLLTNPSWDPPTMGAVVIAGEAATQHMFLSVAATASASVGSGANRGFRANENDPDVLREILTNPNAATNSRGRLFSDRAYTIKSSFVYRFPASIHAGLIARYQDGQPFTRLVIVPGLSQGAEAVQAFARGRSRFALTGTLDLRLQKGIRLSRSRLDVMLDIYNVPNMRKEVEEYVVTGPRFREPTAVQPPRSVHLGLRVAF